MGISETWLNTKIDDAQVTFDKYIAIRSDRTAESKKKGGGGTHYVLQIRSRYYLLVGIYKMYP